MCVCVSCWSIGRSGVLGSEVWCRRGCADLEQVPLREIDAEDEDLQGLR